MAAATSSVHRIQTPERIKIPDHSDEEAFSPNAKDQDDSIQEPNIHTSPFSIQNVLKKERDRSPDTKENVFSTEKLLQNTPSYESDQKLDLDPESPRNDSLEPTSPGFINSPGSSENPYSNPDSVRAEINIDDISCCSDDTVLSVGNEALVYNSGESTSKSTPSSPPNQCLTSFKHIQTHLNAISQLSQNLNITQPILLRPNPITPNPLMFLNQSHLLFQNPLLNQESIKPRLPMQPTSPTFQSQFGMKLKNQEIRHRDEKRLNFPIQNNESDREIMNQNLKFSIDNILKADFGRRITDPLNKRKGHKHSKIPKEVPADNLEPRVPEIGKVGDKSSVVDLSKPEESGSGTTNSGTTNSDGAMVWPAWVYCTRYSDRPSSGRSKYGPTSRVSRPRTRRPKKPPGEPSTADEKRPRTAFSGPQLARLKHEFAENRYLTERRRQALAAELGLAEAQIKIWFQNKRAKLKKASGQRNPLALQLMAQGLYNHSTVPLTREEEELEMQARERDKLNRH